MSTVQFLLALALVVPLSSIYAAPLATADWSFLNETVEGRLLVGTPPALPCFSKYKGRDFEPDRSDCAEVQDDYNSAPSTSSQAGAYQWANWGACMAKVQSCALNFPDEDAPIDDDAVCYQGSTPDYFIEVRKPSDAQAGVNFARKYKVPIVIKNSGHDHKGRSAGPGALGLWMHPYKKLELKHDWTPEGDCYAKPQDAVVIGAGHSWGDVCRFTARYNLTAVGGSSPSVKAAGGWISGGGHSSLSNTYGLGVDNVLEFKTVLPNGEYITANSCQNEEIFWALRGGGASTFGVTMEMTYRVVPRKTAQRASFFYTARNPKTFRQVLAIITAQSNKWASDGWGGPMGTGTGGPLGVSFSFMSFKLSRAEAEESMAPLCDFVDDDDNEGTGSCSISETGGYNNPSGDDGGLQGVGVALSSRLITRQWLEDEENRERMVDALVNITNAHVGIRDGELESLIDDAGQYPAEMLVTTPYNYEVPEDPVEGGTSINPVWRQATWHMVFKYGFSGDAPQRVMKHAYNVVHDATTILREIAPEDRGCYLNESDIFEEDGAEMFWGMENYERLLKLKRDIDPDNVLSCWGCVGWDSSDSRFSCYPDFGMKDKVYKGFPEL